MTPNKAKKKIKTSKVLKLKIQKASVTASARPRKIEKVHGKTVQFNLFYFFTVVVVCQLPFPRALGGCSRANSERGVFIFQVLASLVSTNCLKIMSRRLESSRDAKHSSTPASLRKELRHLSRELSSSDVGAPSSFSGRKARPPLKNTEKENSRPSNYTSHNEWVRGGGNVSPAVFSFSGASLSPLSDAKIISKGALFPAYSNSVSRVGTGENSIFCGTSTSSSNMLVADAGIPRGLMVRSVLEIFFYVRYIALHLSLFSQRISSHVTSDALSHLAGMLCFWRVLASQFAR
jgi:hypothetical protein